jgi:release factor glutamine methyltransferase
VTTWASLRDDAERALTTAGLPSPAVDARWIVEEVAERGNGSLALTADEPAPPLAVRRIRDLVSRRARGEPLQYVLGAWAFRDLTLMVDARVLIPRPETEQTVEVALTEADRLGLRTGTRDPWRGTETTAVVADLGTGSGAIALALAVNLPDVLVWATDRSPSAVAVTRANLAGIGHAATRVRVAEGDWFDALPDALHRSLDLIVSNPPYLAERELTDLPAEVAHYEPLGALVSGPTGLEAIEHLIAGAPAYLSPGRGTLVLEIAPHQSAAARTLAQEAGFAEVLIQPDLAGRARVLVARGG